MLSTFSQKKTLSYLCNKLSGISMKSITSPKNNRNTLLDNVKAFAIVCMVLGHCIQFGSGSHFEQEELYFLNPVFKFIYSFHMPLFSLSAAIYLPFRWKEEVGRRISERKLRASSFLFLRGLSYLYVLEWYLCFHKQKDIFLSEKASTIIS